jgi:2-oxoglutarate dehydrogenase E1 component
MPSAELASSESEQRDKVFDAFRRWGYVRADLDPLGHFVGEEHPELNLTGPVADEARRMYCGTIGAEFMHMPDPERRNWVRERMEAEAAPVNRERILTEFVEADVFEQMLQTL